ncbi:ATP-binding protein [Chryseobacterium manosquense]|uniref:ATP-binding protein n=1 Tax=Chryseobacterium manosquense TaxID=2754694 RepID=A0A7H1DXG7_9FLAO|nr:ATP-binding protein [Chryseobacterium manosquense]QNS41675.1 ATP-binding protein [Chryseobacterium manosquense]
MSHKNILQFWRNVEVFNLPDLDEKKLKPLNRESELPWLEKKITKKNKKIIYTLFFGKVSKENVVKQINKIFADKKENQWKEKISGSTCFSSIVLDGYGQPDSNSYTLASYVLGIDVLQNKKDIVSVYQLLQNVSDEYLQRFNILKPSDGENLENNVASWDFINKEIEYLKQLTGWNSDDIMVNYIEKDVGINTEVDTPFLNSFYLEDLNKLVDDGTELSPTLQKYLTLNSNQKKSDLIKNKDDFFETINPKYLNEGKWASNPKYGLCTAQLGAINSIFKDLKNHSGIQGVNGPPGTGKTTLLLDVIAQIIVDRAKETINIGFDNLFGKDIRLDFKDRYQYVYPLNFSLQRNYGIVVASNNNAAVENISKELPQAKKIDKETFPNADYFGEYAKKDLTGDENWGILAAALGKSENKNNFSNLFWKSFLKDEKGNLIRNDENKAIVDKNASNFQNFLTSIQTEQKNYQSDFEIAKKKFSTLLEDFNAFKKTATDFHNGFDEFRKNVVLEKDLENAQSSKETTKSELNKELQEFEKGKNDKIKERENLRISLYTFNSKKPIFFFFQKLFNTKKYKQWNKEVSEFLTEFNSISSEIKEINSKIEKKKSELNNIENQLKNIQNQLIQIEEFNNKYESLKSQLLLKYEINEENLFDINFYEKDLKKIHLLSPYHSKKIAKIRTEIFLKALDIHKFAILANAKQFKNNLNAFFEMISGRNEISEELTTMLWDSFFFCIPVVSTSLASASRLFPNITKNQVGWLLIDEAGQATPQSVAGLVQRSKRCIIVGDPLQVEPVVTIPKTLVESLLNNLKIDSVWSPYCSSVQQLADRISEYGTQLGDDEDGIWTGFPLRTHRRCFNPMFNIANKIAYQDQMVYGTEGRDKDKNPFIGESCWFDIDGSGKGDTQVINEEIELLKEKIKELRKTYSDEIYVISPFKAVANKCSYDNEIEKDSKIECGTIHIFQGKEADVVFIVLGSHPEKEGTRKWASSKPNMLNVALTRAKKRCYVIGNKKLWSKQPYFDVMAKELDK